MEMGSLAWEAMTMTPAVSNRRFRRNLRDDGYVGRDCKLGFADTSRAGGCLAHRRHRPCSAAIPEDQNRGM